MTVSKKKKKFSKIGQCRANSFFFFFFSKKGILRGIVLSFLRYVCESHSVVSDFLQPHGPYSPWNSPGQNTAIGSLSLLQGIFLTQGSNPGLRHCRRILYQLRHKGSPRILEWVAYPFSRVSSWPRSWIRSPTMQVHSLLTKLPGKSGF